MTTSIQHPSPITLPAVHKPELADKPMDKLVRDLIAAFDEHGDGDVIAALLENYAKNNKDWQEYAHFCPHKYSRNLVARTKMFELIVLCWREGQKSPIHNHEGQRCWMGMLDGQLEETYFKFKNTGCTRGSGPLEQTESRALDPGSVGYITDDIALHVIRPLTKTAVSLHLYSYPIPECSIYCPATGTVTRRRMGFFTEFKKPVPQDGAPGCCPPAQATPISN